MNLNSRINRIKQLDWLRGALALLIAIYHFSIYFGERPTSRDFLGRIGVYGVSMFFIISGISIAISSYNTLKTYNGILSFYIKRILRIGPLYIAASTIYFLLLFYDTGYLAWKSYLLNITLTFGFIDTNANMVPGGWSIGNEIVFYSITPILISIFINTKNFGLLLFSISILLGIVYTQLMLDSNNNFEGQNSVYINPFNNLFFYIAGLFIFFNVNFINKQVLLNFIFLFSLIITFFILPATGNLISILTNYNRLFFSFISILIVLIIYRFGNLNLPFLFESIFDFLGKISYGVYLLHPLASIFINIIFKNINEVPRIIIVTSYLCSTISFAAISYFYFESKIIIWGKGKLNKVLKNK